MPDIIWRLLIHNEWLLLVLISLFFITFSDGIWRHWRCPVVIMQYNGMSVITEVQETGFINIKLCHFRAKLTLIVIINLKIQIRMKQYSTFKPNLFWNYIIMHCKRCQFGFVSSCNVSPTDILLYHLFTKTSVNDNFS